MAEIYLNDIAHGRSGDKGDTAMSVCMHASRNTIRSLSAR